MMNNLNNGESGTFYIKDGLINHRIIVSIFVPNEIMEL